MITNKAKELHFSSLVFDTHSDSLGRTVDNEEDLIQLTNKLPDFMNNIVSHE